jgi:hypothetical protein
MLSLLKIGDDWSAIELPHSNAKSSCGRYVICVYVQACNDASIITRLLMVIVETCVTVSVGFYRHLRRRNSIVNILRTQAIETAAKAMPTPESVLS